MLKMKKVSPTIKGFIEIVDEMLKAYCNLYHNFSNDKVEKIFKMDESAYKLFEKISPTLSSQDRELLHHLKKISRFMVSLTELKIDLNYEN